METFSALLAICAGNSPVTGEFPAQRPVTRIFDVFFDLRLNKQLNKQPWGWWFETPSHPLWRHCNEVDPDLRCHTHKAKTNNEWGSQLSLCNNILLHVPSDFPHCDWRCMGTPFAIILSTLLHVKLQTLFRHAMPWDVLDSWGYDEYNSDMHAHCGILRTLVPCHKFKCALNCQHHHTQIEFPWRSFHHLYIQVAIQNVPQIFRIDSCAMSDLFWKILVSL